MINYSRILAAGFATLLAAVALSPVYASDVEYSYVEGRFLIDAEIENVDGDGFHVGGSYLVRNDIYLLGSFETVDFDNNVDADIIELGAGYIYPLNTQWDSNYELSYVDTDLSGPGGSRDDTGFSLSAGVRGMVTPEFEARAKLVYIDVDDSDTFITLAGDYFIKPNLSAGVEVDLAGDYETLSLGVRYYFN